MDTPRRYYAAHWFAVPLSAFLLLTGCTRQTPPEPEAVRPVKTLVVTAGGESQMRTFPGKVEASKKAELAFQVPGKIINLPVKEGQTVARGEVIAQLETNRFEADLKALQGQLDQARAALRALQAGDRPEQQRRLEAAVRAAEVSLANARSDYDRAERLFRANAGTRADYDRARTAFRVAQEEHEAARQSLEKGTVAREEDLEAQEGIVRGLEGRVVAANINLQDATLRAPFDGIIAQRFVEANQNVQAKQPVVKFQDVDEIDVAVDVPETFMASLRAADVLQLVAEFTAAPGVQFPIQIREVAQRADPVTQTFRVRAAMKAPTEVTLLPGMSANVTLTYRRARILGNPIMVPVSSVYKDSNGEQIVWVVGPDSTVSRRPVKLGGATGGDVEIVTGLQPGDRIAVAGVRFLREGMKVRDLGDALGGQP